MTSMLEPMRLSAILTLLLLLSPSLFSEDRELVSNWEKATELSLSGNHESAIEVLNAMVNQHPDDVQICVKRSGEYLRLKNFKLASRDIYHALSIDPESIDANIALIFLYKETNRIKLAYELLNTLSYDGKPDRNRVLYHCSAFTLFIKNNDIEKAKLTGLELIKMKSNNPFIQKWLMHDKDFDPVRKQEWFIEIINSLPNGP